jgi:hypothetical protein
MYCHYGFGGCKSLKKGVNTALQVKQLLSCKKLCETIRVMFSKLNSIPSRFPATTPTDECQLEWLLCLSSTFQANGRNLFQAAKPNNVPGGVPRSAYPMRYSLLKSDRAS